MSFISSGADAMPTLFCIGEISEVQPTRTSKSGAYLVTEFKISRLASANRDATVYLTWHPDFLRPGYAPMQEGDKGKRMVYDNNIVRDPKPFHPQSTQFKQQQIGLANLQGLCGSEERFKEIANELQQAYSASSTPDELVAKVDEIFAGLAGVTTGYCLKQQWSPVEGVLNEKGYPVKVRGKYYETAGLFYPTKENYEAICKAKAAYEAKCAKKEEHADVSWITFDDSTPF